MFPPHDLQKRAFKRETLTVYIQNATFEPTDCQKHALGQNSKRHPSLLSESAITKNRPFVRWPYLTQIILISQ